jgi:hypothetical protein
MYDELTDGTDDLDLFVWRCVAEEPTEDCKPKDVRLAGFSAGTPGDGGAGGSDELIDISDPIRGYYIVDVHGYDVDLDDDSESGAWFNVYTWYLSDRKNAGNLNVTGNPGTAIVGTSANLTASWNGLDDSIWLGLVTHSDDNVNSLGYTLVEVDNKGFGPIE